MRLRPDAAFGALMLMMCAAPRTPARAEHASGSVASDAGTHAYGQPGSPVKTERPPASAADLSAGATPYDVAPVEDDMIFWHVLFEQLEGRCSGSGTGLRWEGQAWVGTDFNRLRLKTEAFYEDGQADDGDHELLYARPIWFLRYFDWQTGVRYDWDSLPGRVWGAFGIQGLAPSFFETGATFYVSDSGHVAGRLEGSYDILLTNRLIAQPQIELNFYSKTDARRMIGPGLSEIDTGLRIRYEIRRKIAPYVGVAYNGLFGDTASFARAEGEDPDTVRFVFGLRVWL
jgi:copper resistance protein B